MNGKSRFLWQLKRKSKGITQEEIANHLGYTNSMISKYEKNHNGMPEDKVKLYKEYIENKQIKWEK